MFKGTASQLRSIKKYNCQTSIFSFLTVVYTDRVARQSFRGQRFSFFCVSVSVDNFSRTILFVSTVPPSSLRVHRGTDTTEKTTANSKFALCGQNRKFGVRVSYKAFVLADKSFSENPHSANLRNVTSKARDRQTDVS